MAYTPLNVCVYLKAFAGCLAGLGAAGTYLTDPNEGDYTWAARMADAYAQQFDTTWGAVTPTNFEEDAIFGASASVWQTHSMLESHVAFIPNSYTGLCNGAIALVQEGNAQVVIEGVSPSGCSAAGGALGGAQFFGNSGVAGNPDYTATVAVGAPVPFPQNGASWGTAPPTRLTNHSFTLPNAGTYKIAFGVSVTEAGQLGVALGSTPAIPAVPSPVFGRATGTSIISGEVYLTVTAGTIVSVINPPGNSTALTITPTAGGTGVIMEYLTITQVA
jgi:hypothetical protein